jgi:hypothetical protein
MGRKGRVLQNYKEPDSYVIFFLHGAHTSSACFCRHNERWKSSNSPLVSKCYWKFIVVSYICKCYWYLIMIVHLWAVEHLIEGESLFFCSNTPCRECKVTAQIHVFVYCTFVTSSVYISLKNWTVCKMIMVVNTPLIRTLAIWVALGCRQEGACREACFKKNFKGSTLLLHIMLYRWVGMMMQNHWSALTTFMPPVAFLFLLCPYSGIRLQIDCNRSSIQSKLIKSGSFADIILYCYPNFNELIKSLLCSTLLIWSGSWWMIMRTELDRSYFTQSHDNRWSASIKQWMSYLNLIISRYSVT